MTDEGIRQQELGERIEVARLGRSWSRRGLANALPGISEEVIRNIEKCQGELPFNKLSMVAEKVGLILTFYDENEPQEMDDDDDDDDDD